MGNTVVMHQYGVTNQMDYNGYGYYVYRAAVQGGGCRGIITGGLNGGKSAISQGAGDTNSNAAFNMSAPDNLDRVEIGEKTEIPVDFTVDHLTGNLTLQHTDLLVGSKAFPYSLPFTRFFNNKNVSTVTECGRTWSHNYYITATNLYIRVKNARHGVSVPFDQRSKGFIWFFSFLIWFSSIEARANTENSVVLLLDEPGLNLHALAQSDFLDFIDSLSQSRQIIYTTHSPFMVKNDQLDRVRVVEDRAKEGTRVTSELGGSSSESLFPLQAALGYSIAQNLFISKKNILVEGPADLILLTHMSSIMENKGKTSLEAGTLLPVGGLDKLATFVALLGATKLKMVVLHDKSTKPHQGLESLIQQKLIEKKRVIDFSAFRTPNNLETDVEDLFPINFYLDAFNECYDKELAGTKATENALPAHPRVVERLNLWLKQNSILLKQSGGFNHYRVAQVLITKLTAKNMKAADIVPFEKLFSKLNELLAEA